MAPGDIVYWLEVNQSKPVVCAGIIDREHSETHFIVDGMWRMKMKLYESSEEVLNSITIRLSEKVRKKLEESLVITE